MPGRTVEYLETIGPLRSAAIGAVAVGFYSLIPIWKENSVFHALGDHGTSVYSGLEVLLGLLLVLRSNSAYQRWWEGRTLWGKLVNISRNLVIKSDTLIDVPDEEVETLRKHVHAFSAELRDHLRGKFPPGPHRPAARVTEIYRLIDQWRQRGVVSDDVLRVMDSEARELLEVCGGCERILKTPLSRSYRLFIWQGIALLLISLPWSLAAELGAWCIPICMLHAYFFIGVQALARAAEDPFGEDVDDLDLDSLVVTIERTS